MIIKFLKSTNYKYQKKKLRVGTVHAILIIMIYSYYQNRLMYLIFINYFKAQFIFMLC